MGEVVQFPKTKPSQEAEQSQAGAFYCTACRQDFFKLLEDGTVRCYTCERRIHNLTVINDASRSE